MSDETTPLPLEEFILALRAHAAAIEHLAVPGASPESVDPAIDDLRAAALAYDEAVFLRTGLADVFEDLGDDEFDEYWEDEPFGGDDDEDLLVVEEGVQRITLTGRWDFLIRDRDALRELAEQRLREDVPEIDDESLTEHAGEPQTALATLVGHDGMLDYPGLEEAGSQWSISPTGKTLFEMTDDERDQL